jgi:hypothetical protein
MKLSGEQISEIRDEIDRSAIVIQTLKDDVLDHLCCVVEYKLERGKRFGAALSEALHEFAPDGLDGIQRETMFLLNSTKIIRMKKLIYAVGLLSAIAISLGWLFSVLHWPGGDQLFNYGFLGFLLLFVPLLSIDRYKVYLRQAASEKLRIILGSSSAFIIGLAGVFKLLHLQGADYLLLGGMVLFTFGFLPFLFFRMYKKSIS